VAFDFGAVILIRIGLGRRRGHSEIEGLWGGLRRVMALQG
jgi:hypothetical protein